MKNIVIGVASAIVLVLLLFCIYTLQGMQPENGILRFHYTGNGECGSKDDRG